MTELVLVDTNALVASIHSSERHHAEVLAAFDDSRFRFIIPALCVAEATYMVERNFGARVEAAFLESLEQFDVVAPEGRDWRRIAELVRAYADFPLGGTDASIVALAERLNTEWVMTLDRRHFGAVRPSHVERLRLLPDM